MKKLSVTIVILSLLWWAALLFVYPPHGYDHAIYTYNADLGAQAWGRVDTRTDATAGHYLDYTGAQHLVYVIAHRIPLGFELWTLIGLALSLVLALKLRGIGLALVIGFHPSLWQALVVTNWEDKLILLALPMLALYALRQQRIHLAALIVGACCTFNGVLLFFVPVFLLHVWREHRTRFMTVLLVLALAALVVGLPYFPASLSGWQYRAARMAAPEPFWWSLWRLLPIGVYAPWMDKAATLLVAGVGLWAYARRRVSIETALVIALVPVMVLGVYNDMYKYMPMLILMACVWQRVNVMALAVALLLYLPLLSISNDAITPLLLLTCFAPFALVGLSAWRQNRAPDLRHVLRILRGQLDVHSSSARAGTHPAARLENHLAHQARRDP